MKTAILIITEVSFYMKAHYFLLVWLEKREDYPSEHHKGEHMTGLPIQKVPPTEAHGSFQGWAHDSSRARLFPKSFLLEMARTSIKDIALLHYTWQILILAIFNSFSLT